MTNEGKAAASTAVTLPNLVIDYFFCELHRH